MKLIEQLKAADYGAIPGRVGKWLQRVFGSANQREVTRLTAIVKEVSTLEPWARELTPEQVKARIAEWKDKVQKGTSTLEDALPETFALVREAGRRALNMRHFDAQILGGLVLHQGKIAEMVTGEGKTLVATLAASLNALAGKGVYVVTVNDYLARRDRDWMAPIYEYLGLTVGAIQSPMLPRERIEHYACDITYGTNSEFGFDYLRDNMKLRAEDQVQKNLSFAIVDEVDSILIDEARTPLIISGPPEGMTEKYMLADRIARRLKEGVHFEVKLKEHQCLLSDEGVEFAEKLAGVESFYADPKHMDWPHHIETSLRAHHVYQRDKDYVVKDNEVIIVDEFTGRLMPGRRWSDGLHQSVEVKEGIRPREENQTLATITYQNYFRLFKKLAGMTGTAMTEAAEFGKIYKLEVVSIPTNRKLIRRDNEDVIYLGDKDKFQAIVDEIVRLHGNGRPVLVGTTSIAKSEKLSALLKKTDLPHEVLNAKHHEREAQIVAKAGEFGHITVATNMAGRGTDIKLGAGVIRASCVHPTTKETWCCIGCERPERQNQCAGCFKKQADPHGWHGGIFARCADGARGWRTFENNPALPNPWPEKAEVERLTTAVAQAADKAQRKDLEMTLMEAKLWWNDPPCGLHIIGTERHEARRIDNQLRGRTGRQGDPGSSRFFLCFDDDLMKIFARDWVKTVMERLGLREGERIESPMVSRGIARAQKKVEARHFEMRKNLLEYDEVMDKQRRFIYGQRQDVLQKSGLTDKVLGMFEEMVDGAIERHHPDPQKPFEYEPFKQWLHHKCGPEMDVAGLETVPVEALFDETMKRIQALYDKRRAHHTPEMMEKIEQFLLIDTMDNKWKDHLHAMEALKEGIGLRSYAQIDPRNEYKKEGFQKFELLKGEIAEHITDLIFKVELAQPEPAPRPVPQPQPRPQGPQINLPQDPQMAIAMLEAMAAAGQLPPHIQAVLRAGGKFEVAGNQIRIVAPPGFQMPPELAAAAGMPPAGAPPGSGPGAPAAPAAAATAVSAEPTATPAAAPATPVAPPAAPVAATPPAAAPVAAAPATAPAAAAPAPAKAAPKTLPPGVPKPGRNDACPCGSGLKYKKCCAPAFD